MTVSRRMSFIRISRRSGRGRSRQSQQNDINQQMRVISHELKPCEALKRFILNLGIRRKLLIYICPVDGLIFTRRRPGISAVS